MRLVENIFVSGASVFLVYVGRDHFIATSILIVATRIVCFLNDQQKKPTSGATEISPK